MSDHPKLPFGFYVAVPEKGRPQVVEFAPEQGGHWRNQDDNRCHVDPRDVGYDIRPIPSATTPPAPASIDRKRFEQAPCYLCGYNGPGYYQPDTHACAARYHNEAPAPAPADDEQKRDRWMRTALGHLAPAGTWPSDLLRRMWHAKDADEAISFAKEAQKRLQTLWGAWDAHTDASKLGPVESWEASTPAPVTVSDDATKAIDAAIAWFKARNIQGSAVDVLAALESARGAGDGSQASRDVLAERERQRKKLGWTESHDDKHTDGFLATLAAVKALCATTKDNGHFEIRRALSSYFDTYGLVHESIYGGTFRQLLIEAGALILAEIERLDRVTPPPTDKAREEMK